MTEEGREVVDLATQVLQRLAELDCIDEDMAEAVTAIRGLGLRIGKLALRVNALESWAWGEPF